MAKDAILQRVVEHCKDSSLKNNKDPELHLYKLVKEELSVVFVGILLKGRRIIVPTVAEKGGHSSTQMTPGTS